MAKKKQSELACPFYKRRGTNYIECESIKECKLRLTFKTKGEQADYFDARCGSIHGCQECLIHKALWIKYGG